MKFFGSFSKLLTLIKLTLFR